MAQIISNQANISYSTEGSVVRKTAVSNVANTTLLDSYSLEVSKQSLQQTFTPGENITYTIRVTNTGYKRMNNFTLVDTVTTPEATGYLTYMENTGRLSIGGNLISLNPTSPSPLTFTIPNDLGFGESFTLTYVATVSSELPISVLEISNSVTATGKPMDAAEEVASYSNTDTATIQRNSDAILTISKSVSKATIFNDDSYQYVLTINNLGLSEATNVVITDTLPKGFTVSGIRVENGDFVHDYDPSEYTISEENLLTIPSDRGTAINVRAYSPETSTSTTVTINGNFVNPAE